MAYSNVGNDIAIDTPLKGSEHDQETSKYYNNNKFFYYNYNDKIEKALLEYYYNKKTISNLCSTSRSPRYVVYYEKDINLTLPHVYTTHIHTEHPTKTTLHICAGILTATVTQHVSQRINK
jgi:hypothetical protein